MINIDKRALREAAEKAISEEGETWWSEEQLASDYGLALHKADAKFIAAANPATVLALLDELEAKDQRVAELSALQGKPIAWESTTPVYVKFITDERYQRLRPGYQKWYKPYRCSQCAAAGKGE
ncbi:ead/Ea22-like family protein [Enterobacter roggenkampii]|uniref:ead/Ea22-like family protein n=1 Tax=Enterobacter roggenkampii TaxID=1812935 RepID=UPI0025AC7318|nr:ead/Ea22-like family protein [Enterobacter roggenkampii]WJS52807.1 ead/Ea22-like family protein [Enterobacter roggenkampii]